MKQKLHLNRYALAAILAGFGTVAIADDSQPGVVPQPAAQPEVTVSDRYGTIAGIVAMWEPTMGQNEGWEEELTTALNGATDAQLLSIQGATSYNAVSAILQGQSVPLSLEGVVGTEDLGDLDADLVYTPVFPCRFYDTRNVGAAPGNNAINSYRVFGSGAAMSAQGGNAAGCPAPKATHPVGVSINLAAVPVSSSGHLRVWPYLGVQPTASFVNYFGGGNIANSGLLAICYNCGDDISVFNRNTAHSFADAMGYFYPAIIPVNSIGMSEIDSADLESGFTTTSVLLVAGSNYAMASSFVANATGKCEVNAEGQIWNVDSTDTDTVYVRTARKVGAAAEVDDGSTGLYTSRIAGSVYSSAVGASAIRDVTGGTTYEFGCFFGGVSSGTAGFAGDTGFCRVSYMCY